MADVPIDKFLIRKLAGEHEIDERTLLAALTSPSRRHKTLVGVRVARAKAAYVAELRARGILVEEPEAPAAEASPDTIPSASPVPAPASADATPIPTGDPPTMRHVEQKFPHTLAPEEVVRRARIAFDDYAQKYPDAEAKAVWTGPAAATVTFRAADQTWTINVTVTASDIVLASDVEDRWEMLVNLAVGKIGEEIAEWLAI